MSRPWMPFYPADFLADTMHLSAGEIGAYMLLIMHYWQRGCLPNDDARLASIARFLPEQWASSRAALAELFDEEWRHGRIEEELTKADEKYRRRAEAGRKGGIAKSGRKQSSSNARGNATAKTYQPQPHSTSNEVEARTDDARKDKVARETPQSVLERVLDPARAAAVIEHRKKKRAPLTLHIAELLAAQFARFEHPNRAADVMMNRGWSVIEPGWDGAPPLARPGACSVAIAERTFIAERDARWPALQARWRREHNKTMGPPPRFTSGVAGYDFPNEWIAEAPPQENAA